MAAFRESVSASFVFKFYLSVLLDLATECGSTDPGPDGPWPPVALVPDTDVSAAVDTARPVSSAVQTFDVPSGAETGALAPGPARGPASGHDSAPCPSATVEAAVGAPVPHISALLQASHTALLHFIPITGLSTAR